MKTTATGTFPEDLEVSRKDQKIYDIGKTQNVTEPGRRKA